MFVPNPRLGAELTAQPEHREGLAEVAEDARAKAAGFAGLLMPRPGVEQFVVVDTGEELALVNTDHGAAIDEWGSAKNNPVNAPLRRGVRAAGLRLVETPKS